MKKKHYSCAPRWSLKAPPPLFWVKFMNWRSSPLVPLIQENTPTPLLHASCSIFQDTVFSWMSRTSEEEGWFINFTQMRGGGAFKDEQGGAERYLYFNDWEKLLKEYSNLTLVTKCHIWLLGTLCQI